MGAVLYGVRELLHLDRILQNLLCVLEIMHDLDAHCCGLRSTIGAHENSASKLSIQVKGTIECEEGDKSKAVQLHKFLSGTSTCGSKCGTRFRLLLNSFVI